MSDFSELKKKKLPKGTGGGYKPILEAEPKPNPVRQETTRELAKRQRLARREELTYSNEDYARWDNYRRNAGQQAYDLTEQEWNQNLQDDLKSYLEGRHTQVCILSVEDAAKCALNIWQQKNEDGETIGNETLKLLDEIHSNIDIGVGVIAAAKVSKALGGLGVTVKQYIDNKGIERVIISSLWNDKKMHYAAVNGLNVKKNHPYRIANPTVKQLGVLAQDTINGFKKGAVLSLIVSAVINTNELVFNDDYDLVDWCGSMGSDLFKSMTVLAVSALAVSLTVAMGISMPIVAGVLVWVGIEMLIGSIWDEFEVEDAIVNELKNATN